MRKRSLLDILNKARAGQSLSLRNRLRLRVWQSRQQQRYLASLNHEGSHRVGGGLVWGIRIVVAYGVGGVILWLTMPLIGLGYALFVAMLAWIVMGAYWLS